MFIEWISHRRKCMIYPLEHGWEELNEILFSGGCRHNNHLPAHYALAPVSLIWNKVLLKRIFLLLLLLSSEAARGLQSCLTAWNSKYSNWKMNIPSRHFLLSQRHHWPSCPSDQQRSLEHQLCSSPCSSRAAGLTGEWRGHHPLCICGQWQDSRLARNLINSVWKPEAKAGTKAKVQVVSGNSSHLQKILKGPAADRSRTEVTRCGWRGWKGVVGWEWGIEHENPHYELTDF